jgi:hypothetical protein
MIAADRIGEGQRLPCLLYIMSSMKPAVGARSWISTALTSVAAWDRAAHRLHPASGIQITRSTGVLVGSSTPVMV